MTPITAPIDALVGFAAWTMLLAILVFLYRGVKVLTGTPINSWPRGSQPAAEPAIMKRIADAHANSLENLPLFAVIVLSAAALSKLPAIAPLAPYVLYARIGQSLAHMVATNVPLVMLRATCWTIQLALFAIMFKDLLT